MTAELKRLDDERFDRLESKVDNILERVLLLPCKEGTAKYEALEKEVGWLQKILTIFIPMAIGAIGGVYLILLPIGNTVEMNTLKWQKLEPEHVNLMKDVEVLKTYGRNYGKATV